MSIQSQIDRLSQAKTDIKTAIEGKGVTVPTETTLDGMGALISSIETGGGGGGGGGASLDTCTVKITTQDTYLRLVATTTVIDEEITAAASFPKGYSDADQEITIENVLCGSAICVLCSNTSFMERTLDNAELVGYWLSGYDVYRITAPANGVATINIICDD